MKTTTMLSYQQEYQIQQRMKAIFGRGKLNLGKNVTVFFVKEILVFGELELVQGFKRKISPTTAHVCPWIHTHTIKMCTTPKSPCKRQTHKVTIKLKGTN